MSKMIDDISLTMFSTPSNALEAKDKYKNDLQNKINETYWTASNTVTIQEEQVVGSRIFSPIECRVVHAIEPKTGLNLGDDFKELLFFDLDYDTLMGKRFQFDDSWWIVINTDNYHHITKSAIVRRCNNVLKFKNKGNIIEEPCIVEYALKYSNVYFNNLVDIASGAVEIICQNNENSRLVTYNNRFILGSEVYKVKTIKNFLRQKTFVKGSNPIVNFSVYVDVEAPDDDYVNGIAGTLSYNDNEGPTPPVQKGYEVVFTPDINKMLIGEENTFNCSLYLDGIKTSETFAFVDSGVPKTHYSFTAIDGNNFKILNKQPYFNNNLNIQCTNQNLSRDFSIALRGYY